MFHLLEQRRLLSVSAEFYGGTGILQVTGTDKPEAIDVTIEYALVKPVQPTIGHAVTIGAAQLTEAPTAYGSRRELPIESGIVTIFENGNPVRRWSLPLSSLKEVDLDGAGGSDVLTLFNYATPVYGVVLAGEGNDVIEVSNAMGGRGAEVFAGAGDDTVYLVTNHGALLGHIAYGEAGNDLIYGSANGDHIWGDDAGLAEVYIPQGDDTIFAGAGNDRVWGGGGSDNLHGDEGDDWLWGGADGDYVDGDDGFDCAVFDVEDKFERIEEMEYLT
jgi:Ca2+-binding RTX toxin-like protein